jgi:2-polyprenyl-6-methoxyphenol hydroxylase-like FAD-dependent oxidoreductase
MTAAHHSMPMTQGVPVLIAGAGPAGLTLACELARRGVPCRVVDKAPQLFLGSRAKGLQPRTLEVFDDLGVIEEVLASGAPFPPFRLYAGRELKWERSLEQMLGGAAAVPAPATAGVPYPRAWLIPQWRTDQILHDRFVALGGRVELETELVDVAQEQDGSGVTATLMSDRVSQKVRARYLIGADGGRSLVRKRCGVAFEGAPLPAERTLIGDVKATGLDGVACHILTRAGDATSRFSLWNLPASEHYQLVANLPGDDASAPELTLAGVQRLLEERTGRRDVRLLELRWISIYRVQVRMAERFRLGRVFLVGDAAHVHSSAVGQGLNTSVQDAYNLGWKLAAALGGAADGEALLDSYEQERRPIAAAALGLGSKLHREGFRAPPGPPSRGEAPALHQLDVSYRGSPFAFDDRLVRGALQAGDRAPDAVLANGQRLFDLLRGPHFTLLVFGERLELLEGDARVVVEEVGALEGYDVEPGQLVLVRPDGYVGAISSSLETIRGYLYRLM